MVHTPRLTLSGVVLDSPDARVLADFYRQLLGWTIRQDEPDWVTLTPPDGGAGLSFQTEAAYVRPTWPADPGDQQMMVHLDIEVDDLDTAEEHAVAAGAVRSVYQPQQSVGCIRIQPDTRSACSFASNSAAAGWLIHQRRGTSM